MKLRRRKVMLNAVEASSVSTSDIERDFYNEWAIGDRYWWWVCLILVDPPEVIVNDGSDNLFRLAVTTADDGSVAFGEPVPVRIEFVDAMARQDSVSAVLAGIESARGEKVAAKYTTRAESRQHVEGDAMREYIAKLRAKLGLGDDVSDEQVLAAAATALEATPEVPVEPGTPGVPEGDDVPNPTGDPDPAPTDPPDVPTGAVVVDASALASLQADAAAGREARNTQLRSEREGVVAAAIKAGKIPPRSRESYLSQMERDPKGTREFLGELAENVVPVSLRGQGDSQETQTGGRSGDLDAWLTARMPDVAARKAGILAGTGASRIMTDA